MSHILVIGGAGVDYKAYSDQRLVEGAANLGVFRMGYGGVARNIAENLARLQEEVILLTVLGGDTSGDLLVKHATDSGINMDYVRRLPRAHTASYTATFQPGGELFASISDFEIFNRGFDMVYIEQHEALFADAKLVVVDANAHIDAIEVVLALATKYGVRVAVDPTLTPRAAKLTPYLQQIFTITPNMMEAAVMTGMEVRNIKTAKAAAQELLRLGVEIALVTVGGQGMVYAYQDETHHVPPLTTTVVDVTGAGDALFAGIVYGLLHDYNLSQAVSMGMRAAMLTLQVPVSVNPDLKPDLLEMVSSC